LFLFVVFTKSNPRQPQVAVCNLASIAVNQFVRPDKTFDFDRLKEVTKVVTRNLNKIIDVNYYPVEEAQVSHYIHAISGEKMTLKTKPPEAPIISAHIKNNLFTENIRNLNFDPN
jgi:hypothetical protein